MKHLLAASMLLLTGAAAIAQIPAPNGTAGIPSTSTLSHAMTDAQIKQHLEAQGYSNVVIDHTNDDGKVYATAMKNGKSQKLAVDSVTGQAKPDIED